MLPRPTRALPEPSRVPESRRAGFTIAELMVVILIFGLVMYTVSVSVDAILPGERLNSSVRNLAAEIQGVRSAAITRNAEFWLEYDLENEAYRRLTPYRLGGGRVIGAGDFEEDRFITPWEPLEQGVAFESVTVSGTEYVEGTVLVRFDPLGASSDHTIVMKQPAFENYYTIEVLALTGLIRFHEDVFIREPPQDEDFN